MKFILVMVWLAHGGIPLTLGPFDTEKLCVDAAATVFAKWKVRYVSGDFACIPTAYPQEEEK